MQLGYLRWVSYVAGSGAEAERPEQCAACCGLRAWIDGYGRAHFAGRPAFARLERAHRSAHRRADEIAAERRLNGAAQAERLAQGLWQRKGEVLRALQFLGRRPGSW